MFPYPVSEELLLILICILVLYLFLLCLVIFFLIIHVSEHSQRIHSSYSLGPLAIYFWIIYQPQYYEIQSTVKSRKFRHVYEIDIPLIVNSYNDNFVLLRRTFKGLYKLYVAAIFVFYITWGRILHLL